MKTILSNLLAVSTFLILIAGYQVSEPDKGDSLISLGSYLGIEEAYAGPCGDAGCDGEPGLCGKITVIKFFSWEATRTCKGSKPGNELLDEKGTPEEVEKE